MTKENSFPTVLFLIFLVLKLCHQITWSWWWVTSPLWIPLLLVLIALNGLALWQVYGITKKIFGIYWRKIRPRDEQ